MPERFLLQILRHLVTHGILHSTRGVEGGYTLDRKPEQVSLLDVIEAIEGPLTSAPPAADGCASYEAKLRKALDEITCTVRQQLEAIKLVRFARGPGFGQERRSPGLIVPATRGSGGAWRPCRPCAPELAIAAQAWQTGGAAATLRTYAIAARRAARPTWRK